MSTRRLLLGALLLSLLMAGHDPVHGTTGPGVLTVEIPIGDLAWVPGDGGYRATIAGASPASVPGGWDIPLLPVTVLPPAGTRVASVSVLAVASVPVRPPGAVAVFRLPDQPVVSAGQMPQEELAIAVPLGYLRGDRADGLSLAPLRRLRDGSWELVTKLTLALRLETDDARDALRPGRGRVGVRSDELRGRVFDLEPERALRAQSTHPSGSQDAGAGAAFQPLSNPSMDGSPVEYVIITSEAMAAEYQRLADWRTRGGVPTVVRTVEWIRENYPDGVDLPERIRTFIKDAVSFWGTEWVLLGGDTPILPVRYGRTAYYTGEFIPTDLYYQCLDGNWNRNGNLEFGEGYASAARPGDSADLMPDVWIGRVPSQTAEDARAWVDKVLAYEIAPPVDDDYPASALMLAEVIAPQNWFPSDAALFDGAILSEETVGYLPSDFKIKRLYENYTAFEGAEVETISTVLEEINRGYGLLHHVGHGYYNNMAVGRSGHSIIIPQADALQNAGRPSVLYAINCTSAAIDFDCIAEHFLFNRHGGALASVGATRFDFPGTSHVYDLEFCKEVFPSASEIDGDAERLGKAASLAKLPFVSVSTADNSNRWMQFTLIYLGDPYMAIWARKPGALSAVHPSTFALGAQTIPITVREAGAPVAGARVTLFKDGETFASALTDASGSVTLVARPRTTGTLQITAVALDRLPYLADITVTAPVAGYPVLAGTAVDDVALSPANGNGRLEAGERARVEFQLRNRGSASLNGLAVSSMTEGGALAFTPLAGGAPSLSPDEEAAFPFEVQVTPSVGDRTVAQVTLTVTANEGTWTIPAVLELGAPDLRVYQLELQELQGDGDGIAEPGETAGVVPQLVNRGSGESLALTASLSLADPQGAEILDGTAAYAGIPAGAVRFATETPAFQLRLGPSSAMPRVRMVVSDGVANRFDSILDFVRPLAPTPGLARGAESSITLTWTASTSSDVARYVVYRAMAAAGPFERLSGFEANPFTFFVDEPLPGLAIRYYRVAAQDSSGNISTLNAVTRGTAALPLAAGFPLAATQGTQASPLVVDLDGDGVLDAITGREQIYAFHGDGSEVRDGDVDARTLGAWSNRLNVTGGYWASPAVADMDGDGRLELVGVSRAEGEIAVWDGFGQFLRGWPQYAWTGDVYRMSTPVLADATGDGLPEIFFQGVKGLWGFNRFGQELRDGDNDPSTHGIFSRTEGVYSYGSVAAADLDGDGRDEIVLGTRLDGAPNPNLFMGRIHVLDDDGTPFPGWPVAVRGGVTSSPALADLDRDGKIDIIITTGSDSLEVRGLDGKSLPGWPKPAYMQNQDLMPSPAVADVDNDGTLDVVCVSGNGTATLWHADGTSFDGFPVTFPDELGRLMSSRGSPSVANLDEDDDLEFVWGNRTGWIFALNKDGSYVDGFPLKTDSPVDGGVLVTDLDGDGLNEIVVSGFERGIYVFHSRGHVVANPGWPMFRHDPRRTGYVGTPLREAVEPRLALGLLQGAQLPEFLSVTVVATKELASPATVTLDGAPIAVSVTDAARRFYRATATLTVGAHQVVATATDKGGRIARSERSVEVLGAPRTLGWLEARQADVGVWAGTLGGWPGALLVQRVTGALAAEDGTPPGDGERVQVGPVGSAAPPGTQVRFAVPSAWTGATVTWWDGAAWRPVMLSAWSPGSATVPAANFGWYRLSAAAMASVEPRPALAVSAAAPNPFAAATRIAFVLSAEARVRAEIFDVTGRRVRVLADRIFPAGDHALDWDGGDDVGRSAPAGVFFVRVVTGEASAAQRIVRVGGGGER
jgi:hypothetical protein